MHGKLIFVVLVVHKSAKISMHKDKAPPLAILALYKVRAFLDPVNHPGVDLK